MRDPPITILLKNFRFLLIHHDAESLKLTLEVPAAVWGKEQRTLHCIHPVLRNSSRLNPPMVRNIHLRKTSANWVDFPR